MAEHMQQQVGLVVLCTQWLCCKHLLKDLDKGQGISSEAMAKLHHTTHLALWATKQTTATIGQSMAVIVATDRHLCLNKANIGGKEKNFLFKASVSLSQLFFSTVIC